MLVEQRVVFKPTDWRGVQYSPDRSRWVIAGFTPRGYFTKGLAFEGYLKGLGFPVYPLSPPEVVDGLVNGNPCLRALREVEAVDRRLPEWPHPLEEDEAVRTGLSSHPGSLRYVLQIEGVRVLAYLSPQPTDPALRLLAPGFRCTIALARRHPDVLGEGDMWEMDSDATSSSSGIGSDFREQGNPQPQATSQGPGEASESSSEMWLPSEYGSSREEQLNMMMEFMRVHDFHDWDLEYRPDVAEDRVLRWWRDEHRIPWQPEVEGLNDSEVASVHMMVGYLMQPRSPATRSSTLSLPVMRSFEVISSNIPGLPIIPSYLGGADRREEGPGLRMLEVIDDGQESEPERTTVSLPGADATSYHQAWEWGRWRWSCRSLKSPLKLWRKSHNCMLERWPLSGD